MYSALLHGCAQYGLILLCSMKSTRMWSVSVSTVTGSTWSPILSLRSQWCPHSLANKWAQSGHPHNGVPPACGSERGTREQLAPRGAADQRRPVPLRCWGQHRKWHVWGGPPPHYWRYLVLCGCNHVWSGDNMFLSIKTCWCLQNMS